MLQIIRKIWETIKFFIMKFVNKIYVDLRFLMSDLENILSKTFYSS